MKGQIHPYIYELILTLAARRFRGGNALSFDGLHKAEEKDKFFEYVGWTKSKDSDELPGISVFDKNLSPNRTRYTKKGWLLLFDYCKDENVRSLTESTKPLICAEAYPSIQDFHNEELNYILKLIEEKGTEYQKKYAPKVIRSFNNPKPYSPSNLRKSDVKGSSSNAFHIIRGLVELRISEFESKIVKPIENQNFNSTENLEAIKKEFAAFICSKSKNTLETAESLLLPLRNIGDLQSYSAFETINRNIDTKLFLKTLDIILRDGALEPITHELNCAAIFWMFNMKSQELVRKYGHKLIKLANKFENKYGDSDTQIDSAIHVKYYIPWITSGINGNFFLQYRDYYSLVEDARPYDDTLSKDFHRERSLFCFSVYDKKWDNAEFHLLNMESMLSRLLLMSDFDLRTHLKHHLLNKKASLVGKLNTKVENFSEQLRGIYRLVFLYKNIYEGLVAKEVCNSKVKAERALTSLKKLIIDYGLPESKSEFFTLKYVKVKLELFTELGVDTYFDISRLRENRKYIYKNTFIQSDSDFKRILGI